MLEIDYGLAGSGKSRYINQLFAQKLDTDEKLMILVPDQHSFITERSVLEDFGMRDGAKIKVIWFNNLARVITEKYGGVKAELLNGSGKAVLMSKAIEQVSEQLEYYRKQASRPDFIGSMLNFTTEMKFSKTDLDALVAAGEQAGSAVLKKKIGEISLITARYDALVSETYLNPDDVLTQVNAILEEHPFFEGYTVAIDGFGFFDRQKLDIIAKIIKQSKDTYITLCTDTLEAGENEADKFESVKKTAHKLIEAARAVDVDVRVKAFDDLSALKAPFACLSRGIYTPAAPSEAGGSEAVQIYAAANIQRECLLAAQNIKKLIMHRGYRYKDIAVIVRDEEQYTPYLKRAFEELEIPYFKDARHDVANEPLMLFCHFALKAVAENFRLDDVMSCIKSAVTGIDTEEISDFENYCIIWNINGRRKWSRAFEYNPQGFTERFREEDKALLEKINATRKKIILPLLAFADKIKDADVKTTAAALYELLVRVHAAENLKHLAACAERPDETAQEQSEVWAVMMNCLEQLVATRGDEVIGAGAFLSVLDLAVGSATIGVLPQRIDEILIGSAERIRTDLPKAAFLLGVNEGAFPKGYTDAGILTDAERVSLLQQGVELGVNFKSMSMQERFFAYCAALAPSEYLYLSYASGNLEGEALGASSLIREIRRLLPEVQIQQPSAPAPEDILTEEQGFDVLTRLWHEDTPLRHTLFEIYKESERFGAKTALIEKNSAAATKQIENPDAALQLFGESMAISPTQLENYSKCPFMYFCKYGMRAKTVERAALDARTGGTLIHYVLEHMVRDMGKKGITELDDKGIREYTDKYVEQYLKELDLPEEFVTGRFKYIVSKNKKIIIATIEQMAAEMRQSDFEPVDFELKVGKHETGGYEVPLEKGTVSLMGTVDRVDMMQNGDEKFYRIIDYKTGSKEFKLGEVLHGINAQMLIYLLSLSTDTGEKYGGSVPAGLLYINAADQTIKASHSDASGLQKGKDGRYKMSGMILGEDEVIHGMEHEPSGRFIPIEFDRKGNVKGQIVSREQMQKIKEKLDSVIAAMGNALHHGEIDDMPFTSTASSACDWCDYKAVCRNKDKKREVSVPRFEQALQALEGGEDNE